MNLHREEEKNWYIRMTAKFFSDKEIIEIKSLPETKYGPNFSDFVICLYLEMLCSSIPDNGLLLFGNMFLDNDNISYAVARKYGRHEKVGSVQAALLIMQRLKLIEFGEIEEGKTIFIPAVINNTGSSKLTSEQRRQRRIAARDGNALAKLPSKENSTEEKKLAKLKFGNYRNVLLTADELSDLKSLAGDGVQRLINYYSKMKYLKQNGLGEQDYKEKTDYEILIEIFKREEPYD